MNDSMLNTLQTAKEVEGQKLSKPNSPVYSKRDILFALAMLVCGFLYWNLIRLPKLGAGVTVFAIIFCLCTALYLKNGGFRQTGKSLVILAVVILSSLVFLLFDNILIKMLNFIFLTIAVIYWICVTTGTTLEKRISIYMLGDFFNQVLIIPLRNFSCCFGAVRTLFIGNQKGKSLLAGLLGILVIIPVLAAVIGLLSRADAAFSELIAHLQFGISMDLLLQIILGIPVACYLFGLIFANRYKRNTGLVTIESVDKVASACRFVPGISVYTALTALNLVYIVFFLSQLTYLFSAFANRLPEMMTYAEYARRGFFELCTVAGINLVVITAAHLLAKREKIKVLQIETVALCVFTLMLILTAISKMVMYIDTYGLTQLRVYTSWFMLVLFFIFAVTAIRQFKQFNAARTLLIGFVVFFLLLSYGNIDGRIAAYNIDRYKNGTLESLDVKALGHLSEAAVPHLYALYQETSDQSLKVELKEALKALPGDGVALQKTFRDFNLQSYKAENIRMMLR
jgi:hypothetical protein